MENGEKDIIKAYQECFNNDYGQTVLEHLREISRMNRFDIDPKIGNDELRSYYFLGRIVNYIEHMRSLENFDRPHSDNPFGIITNEI